MHVNAKRDPTLSEDYIEIRYRELTPVIHRILQLCDDAGVYLLCELDSEIHRVNIDEILYIEWVDTRCCVYTEDEVYTMPDTLSRIEDALKNRHFIRISKSAIVNIYKIKSVGNSLNFRLTAQLTNNEKIIVSRRYRSMLLDAIRALAQEVSE